MGVEEFKIPYVSISLIVLVFGRKRLDLSPYLLPAIILFLLLLPLPLLAQHSLHPILAPVNAVGYGFSCPCPVYPSELEEAPRSHSSPVTFSLSNPPSHISPDSLPWATHSPLPHSHEHADIHARSSGSVLCQSEALPAYPGPTYTHTWVLRPWLLVCWCLVPPILIDLKKKNQNRDYAGIPA